jgi:hypothetical protein
MSFLELRRRGLWRDDGNRMRFHSRSILVTDVLDAKRELEKVCDRVEVVRGERGERADSRDLLDDLENISDVDLERIALLGWIDGCNQAVVRVRLGSRVPADMDTRRQLVEESAPGRVRQIENGSFQAASVIGRAGRPILSPSQWRALLKAAVWLLLGALYVWYAVTTWLSIPALLVGALAVISAGVLAWQRLGRSIDRRFADVPKRIIVNHMTRDQWRERRWNRRRDVLAVAITAIVTVVATYVAIELAG